MSFPFPPFPGTRAEWDAMNHADHVNGMAYDLMVLGFTLGGAIGPKGDISDRPIANLVYLHRAHVPRGVSGSDYHPGGAPSPQHQYVSLVCAHDDGRFLEAVVQVYEKPFNPRAKPRQVSLHSMIHRDWESLLAAVAIMYPLPKDKP